jgi:hypothetical protein
MEFSYSLFSNIKLLLPLCLKVHHLKVLNSYFTFETQAAAKANSFFAPQRT